MAEGRDEKVWTKHAEEHKPLQPYKFTDEHYMRQWLSRFVGENSPVLDYGCGSGLWKDLFRGYDYHGTDYNEAMLQVARSRYPDIAGKLLKADWAKTQFEDNKFDLVFTSAVIQHNNHADKELILREFHRILKPGGYYMCTENTFREDNYKEHPVLGKEANWRPDMEDGYSFTAQGWSEFIQKAGFRPIFYQSLGEYLFQRI